MLAKNQQKNNPKTAKNLFAAKKKRRNEENSNESDLDVNIMLSFDTRIFLTKKSKLLKMSLL